jgi:hypothetical protein
MADVQALEMDVVTEKSNHQVVGMAVSVCLTPAAPAPLPIPYPTIASVSDGISDSPLRTKVCGTNCATIGSVLKLCHGNEAGTLKEVVSLNNTGPCAPLTGAFTVLVELGPAAITGSLVDMNKAPTPGAGSSASGAGGAGGGGGAGAGSGGAGGGPSGPSGPAGGGGGGGGSSGAAAASTVPTQHEKDIAAAPGNSPEQIAAREKVVRDFYGDKPGLGQKRADADMGMYGNPPVANTHPNGYGIDLSQPVAVKNIPPPATMDQYVRTTGPYAGTPGNYFDPVGGQTGSALGLNTDPNFRKPTTFNTPPGQGLQTTAGPIADTWTDQSPAGRQPYLQGGGQQMTVDNGTKSGATCVKCGGNPCTCPGPRTTPGNY